MKKMSGLLVFVFELGISAAAYAKLVRNFPMTR